MMASKAKNTLYYYCIIVVLLLLVIIIVEIAVISENLITKYWIPALFFCGSFQKINCSNYTLASAILKKLFLIWFEKKPVKLFECYHLSKWSTVLLFCWFSWEFSTSVKLTKAASMTFMFVYLSNFAIKICFICWRLPQTLHLIFFPIQKGGWGLTSNCRFRHFASLSWPLRLLWKWPSICPCCYLVLTSLILSSQPQQASRCAMKTSALSQDGSLFN